jgi:hypothetical protein
MKTFLFSLTIMFIVGCSAPRYHYHRLDGPPFIVGDVVFLANEQGYPWTVEKVEGEKLFLLREPVERHFIGGKILPTERQIYPAQLMRRRVEWMSNEPEPAARIEVAK